MKLLVILLSGLCGVIVCESSEPHPNSILLVATNSEDPVWNENNELTDEVVTRWEYIRNNTAIQPTPDAFELRLSCEADFPITWNITGDIKSPEVLKIQPNKRTFLENGKYSYILGAILFFEEDSASSSTFHCQSVERPEIRKFLDVFKQGKDTKPFIHSQQSIQVEDSNILPCSVTNASLSVFLQKQNVITGRYENVPQTFEYNPRYGFISEKLFSGYFSCKIKEVDDEVKVAATVRRSAVIDYDYRPRKQVIKVFTSEPLVLECAARSKLASIKIKLRNENNLWMEDKSELRNHAVVIVHNNGTKVNSTAACEDDADKATIWTWEIEFVEPPELFLNNYEGEVSCLSEYEDRTVSTVRCVSPSHCEYMKHCFADSNYCNDKRQKQFFSNDIGTVDRILNCYVNEDVGSKPCVRVPYSHLNGIVECKARGLKRNWVFFNSLESTKLYDYHNAEISELIQMDTVPPILYTNVTTKFLCKSVIFLFADSVTFEMLFANSSTQIMNETKQPGDESRRRIEEGNVIGELEINVPLDAVGIRCLAPWGNSSEVLQVERRFVTRNLQKPVFRGEPFITRLTVSESRRRLNCSAIGEPKPKYLWRKNGNILEPSDRYQFIIGLNGESLLEFAIIDESVRGEYECEASNNVDFLLRNCQTLPDSNSSDCGIARASKVFRVEDIQTSGSWGGTAAFSATIAIVLIILICVCILLVFVMQRYLIAKELIRNLTDNEIDEFFNGNPALLGAKGQLGPEFLDLIPYDNHYELDLDEIQFDLSKVLGEGEFSTVVQGFWVSQSRNVAVKIAKPSTDVSLFKNLLSEVKIMIHIGGHPNILSLLGVCTKNIRNRNIFIVMELCNHGSLDILLRKNRRTYINLLDGNQQIDITKADVGATGTKITTLTLVRWSGEIACGMEFLSYKGVVHADLAARNVLIGPNWEAKVSDFGLSRKLYESTNYVKKSKTPLPWRWMAAESLMSLSFSTESDIWSYGVTIWEIFTLGDVPFPNESWDKEFLNRIASGMRMGKPKYANPEIYSQIVACWDEDPSLRPQFSIHRKFFLGLYTKHTGETEPGEYIHKTKNSLGSNSNYTEISAVNSSNPNESETEATAQPHLYGNVDLVGNEMYSNAQL